MSGIEELRRKRFQFLRHLYDVSNGNTNTAFSEVDLGAYLGLTGQEARGIAGYLHDEELTRAMYKGGPTKGAMIAITHKGIKEVDAALGSPEKPTHYFPPVNLIMGGVHNSVIQQGTVSSEQSVTVNGNSLFDLAAFLDRVDAEAQGLKLAGRELTDLKAEVATIRAQLTSSRPKTSIVRECLLSIKRILENAAGTLVAQQLLPYIPTLLGGLERLVTRS